MEKLVDIYIGRQPIFNRDLELYAYELLFRGNPNMNSAVILDNDRATAQVLVNAFVNIGIANLVGSLKAFVNFSESFLLKDNIKMLPRKQLVVEVLETVRPTDSVIRAVKELKEDGYEIALDDFFFTDEFQMLVMLADIVKVDLLALTPKQLTSQVADMRRINPRIRLLAEKVETQEQYLYCKSLGFDYFQGYFFAKPQIVKGQHLPTSKLALLELLAKVYDNDIELDKLTEIIRRDVSLSVKLINFVKEHPGNEHIEINSIRDAIMRFGLKKLQSWVSVLALTAIDDKPHALFTIALVRGKTLEELSILSSNGNKETYFMVGLFSCLDALMDKELSEILADMSIASEAKQAILTREGEMGEALNCVIAIEQAREKDVKFMDLNLGDISLSYVKALAWANETLSVIEK